MAAASSQPEAAVSTQKTKVASRAPSLKTRGPLPHFFQVLNLENDETARTLVGIFQEQIALAEEIVKSREELTEAEEALGKVEQARRELQQDKKKEEKKLDERERAARKREKKNAERAARKKGFPVTGGLTVTSTNVLTFVEAQASLASVSGPKDICRIVDVIKNEGTLVSDTGRYFHTGPIRNETTFQLLCGLAFREVAEAREKVTGLEKRGKELDTLADQGHQSLMEVIRKRYKHLSLKYHPDKIGTPTENDYQRFQELQTAHQVLTDTELRRRYIQMMDHNAFLATLPKPSKNADQEGHRPVTKRDGAGGQASRTVNPNDHRRLTGGFPHQCTMPRAMDTILTDSKRGHSRVLLSWSCASAEELQISRYELHVKQRSMGPEASEWVRIYLGWSTEWWTDVLPPGHYSFRVRAENNLGIGEWSTFLDHYIEDIQAVRQMRREEMEKSKEERRSRLAKRLRGQISLVINQTGNVPTTEKLSKLRKLLDQARRSRMEDIVSETEDIVVDLEARVARNEEQHLWKSKLNELVKALLKEDGDGRVHLEDEEDGDDRGDNNDAGDEDEGGAEDDEDLVSDKGSRRYSFAADMMHEVTGRRPSTTTVCSFDDVRREGSLSDLEDLLYSLPIMYPADTPYILPPTIRNQIVQTVQAVIRNRPALRVVSIVPDTNQPSDISLSIANRDCYNRILAVCRVALEQKEYLGGQAGFREVDMATRLLVREIEDANKAMERRRLQIEVFLSEREAAAKLRAEADRASRDHITRSGSGRSLAQSGVGSPTTTEEESNIIEDGSDSAYAETATPTQQKEQVPVKEMDEPPPPYTPRETDDVGTQMESEDGDQDNFEYVGSTPRLRRRGTRGGTRRRKNSNAGLVVPATGASALSETSQPSQVAVSPLAARRAAPAPATRSRTKRPAVSAGVASAAEMTEHAEHGDSTATDNGIALSDEGGEHTPGDTGIHLPVQFGNIEIGSGKGAIDTHAPTSYLGDTIPDPSPDTHKSADLDLQAFLAHLGLQQHYPTFAAHAVTYGDLQLLRESDLVRLGITKVGPRKRIMHLIKEQKPVDPCPRGDIPVTGVISWLRSLDLAEYAEAFTKEEVAFEDLKTLTEDDLVNTFGVEKIGHLTRMLGAVQRLRGAGERSNQQAAGEDEFAGDGQNKQQHQQQQQHIGSEQAANMRSGVAQPNQDRFANSSRIADNGQTASSSDLLANNIKAVPEHAYSFPAYPILDHAAQSYSAGAASANGLSDTYESLGGHGPVASLIDAWGEPHVPGQPSPSRFWSQSETEGGNMEPHEVAVGSLPMANGSATFYDRDRFSGYYDGLPISGLAPHRQQQQQQQYAFPAALQQQQAFQQRPQQQQQQQQQQQATYSSLLQRSKTPLSATGPAANAQDAAARLQARAGNGAEQMGVPPEFLCALTRRLMAIPVHGPDGYYYDHASLRARLIADNTWRSPMTMMYHPVEAWHRSLNNPDIALKGFIDAWVLKTRRRGSVGALNAARDIWRGGNDSALDGGGANGIGGVAGLSLAQNGPHGKEEVAIPVPSQGLKATMGLSGWTADVPGGASIWR
ncbi:uncharacterized protein EV422DRAFT_55652 [Fimicolochytrium jonesii]|uniref:uncharacterized protein n=1 Tax=Fimicolochytrium jonesii TaxID=1396493 RepID=UPI0022FE6740|nr:uncharacterized protein EV422DRAFT_55652 [Fimicolochytrium jonesii]KAI8821147.1 hypothetical protein EV422DRAFT_55652 [Fimicolochytrium jonesii]